MPLILGKKSDQPPEPQQPLFERIQDWIFRFDVGVGVSWYRVGMFSLFVMLIVLLYTGTQFYGLRDPEAMDMGQLARNLMRGRGYVTQTIRPLAIRELQQADRPTLDARWNTQPELWTPPVYPFVLSVIFRVLKPDFQVASGARTLGADRVMMMASWLFYFAGFVLMYLLSRELFDHRVGVLSSFMYLFCNPLLDAAISGVSMNFLAVLFLLAAYGVLKAEKWQLAGRSGRWVYGALAASALAVALGTLTEYAFASVLLPLLVYVGVSFPSRWRLKVLLCVGVFAAVVAPWGVRNWKVSKTIFGLTPKCLLEEMGRGTENEVRWGQVQRTYSGEVPMFEFRQQLRKALGNLRKLYEVTVKDTGANYLIAFFIVALMHRFRQEEVFRLRRFIFWSMLMAMVWISVAGVPKRNFFGVFVPPIIVYGVAFFYVMFERLQFRTRIMRYGVVGMFGVFNALPFLFAILPPRTTLPYPPYDGGVVSAIGKAFREEEMLMSDIPWAVAWYADRGAVWTPVDDKDFLKINDGVKVITGIYLTQQTLLQQGVLDMVKGYQRFWIQLFQPPPPNFPLQVFQPLTPDGQQVLISNRPR